MRSKGIIMLVFFALVIVSGFFLLRHDSSSTVLRAERAKIVISFGEDLTDQQKRELMDYFYSWQKGRDRDTQYITVSNKEERDYLQGLIDEELIGSRAISSVYCETLDRSRGIEVETRNITAITPFMYANALSTAGIENARVIVAAPFAVSGTAALTGIIKAFETAQGEKLDEKAKETAHEEIAETSKLARKIGSNKAEKLIYEVKRQVVERNISEPEEIKKIILEVSAKLNINIPAADIERMVGLMQRLNSLNMNISRLNEQLSGLERSWNEVKSNSRESNGLLNQLLDALRDLITGLKNALA